MKPSNQSRSEYLLRSAHRIAKEARDSQAEGSHDRVIRKSHEAVELWLKGKLIEKGIEPAKTHDLGQLSMALGHQPSVQETDLQFLTEERIPAFYGAPDFIPDEMYDSEDSRRCIAILDQIGL